MARANNFPGICDAEAENVTGEDSDGTVTFSIRLDWTLEMHVTLSDQVFAWGDVRRVCWGGGERKTNAKGRGTEAGIHTCNGGRIDAPK